MSARPSVPYPGVRLLPPPPKPEPVTEKRTPEPVIPYLITCGTAECPETFQGRASFAFAWMEAVAAGWRTDVSRQRRCPQCVAARRPSPTLYVSEEDLGEWLRRSDWLRQLAGPDAAGIALGVNALPVVADVSAAAGAFNDAAFAPDGAAHPYPPAPAAEPEPPAEEPAEPVRDEAPEAGPAATAAIPVTDAPTEAVPVVEEGGESNA